MALTSCCSPGTARFGCKRDARPCFGRTAASPVIADQPRILGVVCGRGCVGVNGVA